MKQMKTLIHSFVVALGLAVAGCTEFAADPRYEPDPIPKDEGTQGPGTPVATTPMKADLDASEPLPEVPPAGPEEPPVPAPEEAGPMAPEAGPQLLAIAWQRQETGYWCGPASTRIALSAWLPAPPTQTELARVLRTTTNGTDHIGLVVDALNQALPAARYVVRSISNEPMPQQREQLKRDLASRIGRGFAIVANVISGWRPPGYPDGAIYHYVAVVGYDATGDKALVADPASGLSARWSMVPRTYWVSTGDLALWIGGKGYSG
jgi:hypothetical protein